MNFGSLAKRRKICVEAVNSTFDTPPGELSKEQIIQNFCTSLESLERYSDDLQEFENNLDLDKLDSILGIVPERKSHDMTHIMDKLVFEYLYRNGNESLAQLFAEESKVVDDETERKVRCVNEMEVIRASLLRREIDVCLKWVESLDVNPSSVSPLSMFCFSVLRMKFLRLLFEEDNPQDALRFAKDRLLEYMASFSDEVNKLMSCFLFSDDVESSPINRTAIEELWQELSAKFVSVYCAENKIASQDSLTTILKAGTLTQPKLIKSSKLLNVKKDLFSASSKVDVPIDLGKDLQFHSSFICPVSKEETSASNPAILLQCGHVISENAMKDLEKSSRTRNKHFKCPTCPNEQTSSTSRRLFF